MTNTVLREPSELVAHAHEMRTYLSDELPNGVGNTIDALCDLIERLTPTPEPCRLREALVEARHYIANCWIDPVAADEERALLARIDSALKQGCAK